MIQLTDGQARKVLVNPDHVTHVYNNGTSTKLELNTGKMVGVVNPINEVQVMILDWYSGQGR